MTSRVLVFHPSVEDDLAAVYGYYEAFDPALSGRFEARLGEQVERIELFPESGAILFVQPGLGRRCRDVRTDSQQSANSPQEVQPRPKESNDAQRLRAYVCAGRSHFSTWVNEISKLSDPRGNVPLQRVITVYACDSTFTTFPEPSRKKKRLTPHSSSVSGWTISNPASAAA